MRATLGRSNLLSDRELLARLVSFDSSSARSNTPIADFVADYLERAGAWVGRYPDDDGTKVNLVARCGPARGGGLLLSGHLDTVPADEPDWHSDPFVLHEQDERLFGRGTADMKGFVALATNLAAEAGAAGLARPLVLLLTCDEELGSLGAQRFVRQWRSEFELPDQAIVGEPTGLRLVRMHKGHLKVRIAVEGKPAHSGYPQLGVNAIEHAAQVVVALAALAAELRGLRTSASEFFPDVPFPVLNIGRIVGGQAINVVPGRCEIDLGVRLLPEQPSDEMLERLRARVEALPADVANACRLEVLNDNPPMLCPKLAPVNIELAKLLRQCATVGVSFASDASWLQRLGMQCVLFGPGRIEDAHRANEFIESRQLRAARGWLEKIANRFCGGEP